ncbi:MAG: hypothetical protein Q7V88_05705 [Actinomycetota bacterium]|nr:hypothetical protein [Actinomycetota bacterium]
MEFAFRYSGPTGLLVRALAMGPRFSRVQLADDRLRVRMGWAFSAQLPTASVVAAQRPTRRPFSRGVHGWRGRWLVNGSGDGLVTLLLQPPQRARVLGVPVRLRELTISLEAPDQFLETLAVG